MKALPQFNHSYMIMVHKVSESCVSICDRERERERERERDIGRQKRDRQIEREIEREREIDIGRQKRERQIERERWRGSERERAR